MQRITKLLADLNATTKRKEKIEIVKEFVATAEPAEVALVYHALDPMYLTGVKTVGLNNERLIPVHTDLDAEYFLDIYEKIAFESGRNQKNYLMQVAFKHLNEADGETFARLLVKDISGGLGISTWNAAVPDQKIKEYPCLLVSPYSEKLVDKLFKKNEYLYCQEKCDGMRFNAVIYDNQVELFGRSGKPILLDPDCPLMQAFKKVADSEYAPCVIDGELLCMLDGKVLDGKVLDGKVLDRKTGNGILNKAVRGTITAKESETVVARVWDWIDFSDFRDAHSDDAYVARFRRLDRIVFDLGLEPTVKLVDTWTVRNRDEIREHFNAVLAKGGEGVIVKSPLMLWGDVRSREAVKFKAEEECDLRIVAVNESKEGGKYDGLMGAIVCESADGLVRVGVGTGFSDEDRSWFMAHKDAVIGRIVTVGYNARIKDKNRNGVDSLFLPRFLELREDKDTADTSDAIK